MRSDAAAGSWRRKRNVEPAAVRRDAHLVRAGLRGHAHALGLPLERVAEQLPLHRVRRGLRDGHTRRSSRRCRRPTRHPMPSRRDGARPACRRACTDSSGASRSARSARGTSCRPRPSAARFVELDPRGVRSMSTRRGSPRGRTHHQEIDAILPARHALHGQRIVAHPLDRREIPGLILCLHPNGVSIPDVHDTGFHEGVRIARLRITHGEYSRVHLAIVEERVLRHGTHIEPVECDAFAVGAPAESVAQPEFFLVHPIARAIDDRIRAIARERALGARRERDDEEIIGAHESGVFSVGGELREHSVAGLHGERRELLAREVENVVVALRVEAPDARTVVVDEHLQCVVGERDALDREALSRGVHKQRGVGEHRRRASRGIDAHDVRSAGGVRTRRHPRRAIGEPVDVRHRRAIEVIAAEDPRDREIGRGRLLRAEREGEGNEC